MSEDFSGILLITDIDNTLSWNGMISPENINAIRYFTQHGGKFAVATGRTPAYVRKHYLPELYINAPIAAINGTVVMNLADDSILWKQPLPECFADIVEDAYSHCQDIEKVLRCSFDEKLLCEQGFCPNKGEEYFKLLIVTGREESAISLKSYLTEKYGEYCSFSRSWATGLEVTNRNANKGKCLQIIKKKTGTRISVAMGDFENDIELLESADISIAVDNAVPQLKTIADFVTVSGEKSAVAHVIDDLPRLLKPRLLKR